MLSPMVTQPTPKRRIVIIAFSWKKSLAQDQFYAQLYMYDIAYVQYISLIQGRMHCLPISAMLTHLSLHSMGHVGDCA